MVFESLRGSETIQSGSMNRPFGNSVLFVSFCVFDLFRNSVSCCVLYLLCFCSLVVVRCFFVAFMCSVGSVCCAFL